MWWVDPGQQPNTRPLACSALLWDEDKVEGRSVDWHNDNLTGKPNIADASSANQGFNSLLPIGQKMSSLFPGSRASTCTPATSSFFPHSTMPYGMGYFYGQWRSALSPYNLLPTPTYSLWEKALMLYEHCSAKSKTLLCYQHDFSQKYKAQQHTGGWKEN